MAIEANAHISQGKKNSVPNLGFILSTLGTVPLNVFTVDLGTFNTFDGTDPKVDRVKPKVRKTIFSVFIFWQNRSPDDCKFNYKKTM